LFLSLTIAGLFLLNCVAAASGENINDFELLQKRIVEDGFNPERIAAVYGKPGVKFETKRVGAYFVYRESKLNYDLFTQDHRIQNARTYMEAHAGALVDAEKGYGVQKEVITAILLVETQLGTSLGRTATLNILSSMAVLYEPKVKTVLWKSIAGKKRYSWEKFKKKAKTKSRWAYKELKAFLDYTAREEIDPTTVYGSFAGAVGISQFMPSNILSLGIDGNRDGRLDLFDHDDAIASVANYLKHHGWRPGIDRNRAYKVVLRYNYSKYYANIILKIADILKG